MHQFVQSAIDAANQGDKNKAMSFLKEVISANPNDADAWLVLAAIVDEPERKRQCLNRVLSLDPTNKLAREELLDMDRASMGGTLPFTGEPSQAFSPDTGGGQAYDQLDSVSKPKSQPRSQPSMSLESNKPATQPTPTQTKHVSLNDWSEEKPKAKTRSAATPRTEKPQVFRYSTVSRIATYLFAVLFGCSFLLALQDITLLLIPCGAFVLILPAVWIVSKQVELSEKGIRTSQLFGLLVSDVGWNEIARIQSKQNALVLTTKKGTTVKVTTQVVGYPIIVETLRQKRPDLFSLTAATVQGNGTGSTNGISPSMSRDIPATAPNFSGIRTFKKNFFKQYGLLLIVIPFCFLAAWTAYAEPEYRIGAGLSAVFCLVMMVLPFFQIGLVKVEPNKLTVESFIEQKAFSARDIREIKMASVRGRYGRVTNYVNIVTAQGKNYPMQGFSDGDEIIYGILHQWWEAYRNR
jgi:hypothetical protein